MKERKLPGKISPDMGMREGSTNCKNGQQVNQNVKLANSVFNTFVNGPSEAHLTKVDATLLAMCWGISSGALA